MMRKWSGEKMKETNLIPHTVEVMYFNVSARTKGSYERSSFRRLSVLVVCKSREPSFNKHTVGNIS